MAQGIMEDAARSYIEERRKRRVTVTDREFVWVRNEDNGEVTLHTGPTMVSPTAADQVVIDDGNGGFKEGQDKPQGMIEVGDNQYVVLYNPLVEPDDGFPNGKFKQGRNEARPLANGTRQMIPGPCSFALRPGQRSEVRDAHELSQHQFLVVKAYGEIDKDAPYYSITKQSAGIVSFTTVSLAPTPTSTDGDLSDTTQIRRGQLIVIRGIDTQFYIPPTGVDIVPDTSCDATGAAISGDKAREILQQALIEVDVDNSGASLYAGGMPQNVELLSHVTTSNAIVPTAATFSKSRGLASVEQAGRRRHRVQKDAANFERLASNLRNSPALQQEFAKSARQTRLVREAVVLSEKEFCVIVDADGKRNVLRGPARVFPGPSDTFMVEGSRGRIYDAYELLQQRALWLRVITPITKGAFASKLPPGSATLLTKDTYNPGDEILLRDVNAFFFPFNEIEVLSPVTGQAVVGNDHSRVFIEAIGIDQKSGIYVRDLLTGEAKLIRGLRSYLVNPAKEVHIERWVSAGDWNHWIFAQRPHKHVSDAQGTPWALSIRIPNNMAVMATSASGQRVIEGPCVELLEYEEKLAYLELSTGTPKHDKKPLKTCFLRTMGNRVSDVIRVQTSDFVDIDVKVTYQIQFQKEFKDRWFNHPNYIQTLVEHLRSLVRNACRGVSLGDLWVQIPDLVRNTILGARDEQGNRPGRLFEDNGMLVTEVEVLNSNLLDPTLAKQFTDVQRLMVSLQIGDKEAQANLQSTRLRDKVKADHNDITEIAKKRDYALNGLIRDLSHAAETDVISKASVRELQTIQKDAVSSEAEQLAQLSRQREAELHKQKALVDAAQAKAEADRLLNEQQLAYSAAAAEVDKDLINARAQAVVAENQSVQPGLIEALRGHGDKVLLKAAAENMNPISLIQGKSVAELLGGVFGNTRVSNTLRAMKEAGTKLLSTEE
jgi:hypothetical protein